MKVKFSSRGANYTGFNSLLEMPMRRTRRTRLASPLVSILYWRCARGSVTRANPSSSVFQFSIGDAAHMGHAVESVIDGFNSLLEMPIFFCVLCLAFVQVVQVSILYWRCSTAASTWAVAKSSTKVSILYWRCQQLRLEEVSHKARGFNSLLEMRHFVTVHRSICD